MKHSLVALSLFALLSTGALAQTAPSPSLLNFQGRLARPDNTPVADGTYNLRFSLHTAASGGTELWNQTLTAITVRNGTFAALLNVGSGFQNGATAESLFASNLWIEIKIGSDAPLTPRQQLVSVAYSLKANSVRDGGVTTNSLADNAVTSGKIADGTIGNADLASDPASLSKVSGGVLNITNNRLFYPNGVIQNGGSAVTGTTDLGLYSQTSNQWMRFVTNAAPFQWYTDSGTGTNSRMTLDPSWQIGTGNYFSRYVLRSPYAQLL